MPNRVTPGDDDAVNVCSGVDFEGVSYDRILAFGRSDEDPFITREQEC